MSIITYRHPSYTSCYFDWIKWRLCYEGGDAFVDNYLRKFSELEDDNDFNRRKELTPAATFAKSAIDEIKNSIFQRLTDVSRRGGSKAYQDAVEGHGLGIDLHGKSMNQFIGMEIVPDLLVMSKVGIFVDQPPLPGNTMLDQMSIRPYLYSYSAEQILSWTLRKDKANEFQSLLLVDKMDKCCHETGLPMGSWNRYRHVQLIDGKVYVRLYDDDGQRVDLDGFPAQEDYVINLPFIPFVLLDIKESLMAQVATAQIALMNLESCDIAFGMKSNHSFLVEQRDFRSENIYDRGPGEGDDGTSEEAAQGKDRRIKVGASYGRAYAPGMEQPAFINPSTDPLKASMDKQSQLKEDIRRLVHLSLSNIKDKMASAESKGLDQRGLEAGLSYIGLVLEHAESVVARIWSAYEGQQSSVASVSYPKNYSLLSDEERRKEVESLEELRDAIPSDTYQKMVSVKMARVLLGASVTQEQLDEIIKEIMDAPTNTAKEEYIIKRVEVGLIDKKLAAKILGMPEETVDKAMAEHAARLAAISASQSAARGNPDAAVMPAAGAAMEKTASRQTDSKETTEEPVRGEGQ